MNFSFTVSYVALWVTVLLQGLLILVLLRQLVELRGVVERVDVPVADQLSIGCPAPSLGHPVPSSSTLGLAPSLENGPTVLLFVSSRCSSCRELIQSLTALPGDRTGLILLCHGEEAACSDLTLKVRCRSRVTGTDVNGIVRDYRIRTFPIAIMIDEKRKIAGYLRPQNAAMLQALLDADPRTDHGPESSPESTVLRATGLPDGQPVAATNRPQATAGKDRHVFKGEGVTPPRIAIRPPIRVMNEN